MKHKTTRKQRKEAANESYMAHYQFGVNISKRKQQARFLKKEHANVAKCENDEQVEKVLTKAKEGEEKSC